MAAKSVSSEISNTYLDKLSTIVYRLDLPYDLSIISLKIVLNSNILKMNILFFSFKLVGAIGESGANVQSAQIMGAGSGTGRVPNIPNVQGKSTKSKNVQTTPYTATTSR